MAWTGGWRTDIISGAAFSMNVTSLVASSGYAAIFLLSFLQSCCVPTSSELTLGFAGVLAAEGKLSLAAVIAVGAAGELIGAYVAWYAGKKLGRGFVDRFGRYVLLSHADLDRAQAWYNRHPQWGVFGSRLLPVIRNFVAVPAGIAEVPPLRFGVLTAAGSLIWDGGMAAIGYGVGSRWRTVMHGFSDAGYVIAIICVLLLAVAVLHRYRAYKVHATVERGPSRNAGSGQTAFDVPPDEPVSRRQPP
jgi:membrane protein DedA with SNARE-associated domain